MKWLFLILSAAFQAVGADVKKGPERAVFHTLAGDLVFAFYPGVAPKTVEQFLKLTRNGIFDTAHFRRLEPGFVLQIGSADDRIIPLNEIQRAIIKKLPAEFSKLQHRRGILSMARYDDDINSATTSFSILLGDAPHLDGQYTIFGELEYGWEVLEVLEGVPINPDKTPKFRLSVSYAEAADTVAGLAGKVMRKAISLDKLSAEVERQLGSDKTRTAFPLGLCLILSVVLSAVGALVGRWMKSLMLLNALICGFVVFCWLVPKAVFSPWIGIGVFAGTACLYRALSFFEAPATPGPRKSAAGAK